MRKPLHRKSLLLTAVLSFMLVVSSLSALARPGTATDQALVGRGGGIHKLQGISAGERPETLTYLDRTTGRDPQVVIGPDSRVQITDTTQDPYKKIVSIWAGDLDTGQGFGCTGTFIGARVIMTAAHCVWFPEYNGYPPYLEVVPGRNVDQEPFGFSVGDNLWVPQGWIDANGDINAGGDFDYALIVLDDATLGNTVGTMTIGVLDDAALMAPDFNPTTAGYPGDKPDGTMWAGNEPSFTDVGPTILEHEIDSFQGQSGSAVWRGADQLIVGIESFDTDTINGTRRITQDIVDDYTGVCQQLGCTFNVATGGGNPPPPPPGDASAFQRVWERTDKPVADGQATRTWMWGPQPNTQVMMEAYDEAPNGQRQVQYYDKSRMEITDPAVDPNSIWYVTNGLLATELISGRMQLGDNRFDNRAPANVNVAGDANDPNGPTYATFNPLLAAPAQPVGTPVTQRVNRASQVTDDQTLAAQGITIGFVDDVTNHGIAAPFWTFMNSSGVVYQNGAFTTAPLFENAFFATGPPDHRAILG